MEKKLYVLQVFSVEQKIPRAFDLHAYIAGADINTDDGFIYQIISSNEKFIDIDIEKIRTDNLPRVKNTLTKEETSIQDKLSKDEILAEKGRCSIFKNGIIVIEHNQHAGGSKKPVESLIKFIEKKIGKNGIKVSYLFNQAALEGYIASINNGELSLDVMESAKLFGDYDLGAQNVPKQRIVLSFKNGGVIAGKIMDILKGGKAKLKLVRNKENDGRVRDSKGVHTTRINKNIHASNDADIFNIMHQYRDELEMDRYLVISGAELISLEGGYEL